MTQLSEADLDVFKEMAVSSEEASNMMKELCEGHWKNVRDFIIAVKPEVAIAGLVSDDGLRALEAKAITTMFIVISTYMMNLMKAENMTNRDISEAAEMGARDFQNVFGRILTLSRDENDG